MIDDDFWRAEAMSFEQDEKMKLYHQGHLLTPVNYCEGYKYSSVVLSFIFFIQYINKVKFLQTNSWFINCGYDSLDPRLCVTSDVSPHGLTPDNTAPARWPELPVDWFSRHQTPAQ